MKFKHLFIILILLLPALTNINAQQEHDDNYIIMYDEGHKQFFTSDMMSTALDSLETALGVNIDVVTNTDKFTSVSTQGADLIIISNPGLTSDGKPLVVQDEEKVAITNFVSNGGGVLYMSNPLNLDNASLTGHAEPLNKLLVSDLHARVHVTGLENDNVSIILDDVNNNGEDNSYIVIDSDRITGDVLTQEPNLINDTQFLIYSSLIESTSGIIEYGGNMSTTAYAMTINYDLVNDGQGGNDRRKLWMEGTQSGDGRVMLLGSTIMFSDMSYDSSSLWVEQMSNLQLFQNLVAWLLHITPSDGESSVIDREFSYFIWYSIAVAVGGFVIITALWYGNQIRIGKLSTGSIFKLGLPRKKKVTKNAQQPKKTKKKTKKSNKRQ